MSRVYLRTMTPQDINDNYLAGFANEAVTEFLEVKGSNLTIQKVIDYMNKGQKDNTYFIYAVCLKSNDKHIGNLKIGPIDRKHMIADLVTVIWDHEQWGKGLATEAIKAGNVKAFSEYNIRKLHGGIYEKNISSIKAYTKAGWIVEGRLQNHYILDGKLQDRVMVSCFNPNFNLN